MDQTAVSHLKNSPYPKLYCFEHINRTRAFRVYYRIICHYLVTSTMLYCGRRGPQISPCMTEWALQDVRVTGWLCVLKCSSGPLHTFSCTYCVINKNTCSLYLTSPAWFLLCKFYGNIWILDFCCRMGNGKARYGSLTLWKCNICSIRKKYICFLCLNLYSIKQTSHLRCSGLKKEEKSISWSPTACLRTFTVLNADKWVFF